MKKTSRDWAVSIGEDVDRNNVTGDVLNVVRMRIETGTASMDEVSGLASELGGDLDRIEGSILKNGPANFVR